MARTKLSGLDTKFFKNPPSPPPPVGVILFAAPRYVTFPSGVTAKVPCTSPLIPETIWSVTIWVPSGRVSRTLCLPLSCGFLNSDSIEFKYLINCGAERGDSYPSWIWSVTWKDPSAARVESATPALYKSIPIEVLPSLYCTGTFKVSSKLIPRSRICPASGSSSKNPRSDRMMS